MRRKWIGFRMTVGLCAALGWWGFLYPELTLTPDTVKICTENEEGELCVLTQEWSFDNNLYLDLLNAEPDKITFRSRLLQEIGLLWEAFHDRIGKQDK